MMPYELVNSKRESLPISAVLIDQEIVDKSLDWEQKDTHNPSSSSVTLLHKCWRSQLEQIYKFMRGGD